MTGLRLQYGNKNVIQDPEIFRDFPSWMLDQVQHDVVGQLKGVPMNKQPAVYMLANKRNGTLYVGVTSDLVKRIWEHKNNLADGFSKRYKLHNLVWYEVHENMDSAIVREKRIKYWKRKWKLALIEGSNPDWQDLYGRIL